MHACAVVLWCCGVLRCAGGGCIINIKLGVEKGFGSENRFLTHTQRYVFIESEVLVLPQFVLCRKIIHLW